MGDAGNWCLIESDPGVFTEMIRNFGKLERVRLDDDFHFNFCLSSFTQIGVTGLQVEEIWSLDAEEFKNLG